MPDFETVEPRVFSVQRNAAALLALLGGDDEDRLRYWEIKKGLTTPAEWLLISHQYDVIDQQLEQLQGTLHTIEAVAGEIANVRTL